MALQSLSFVLSCKLSFHYVLIIAPAMTGEKKMYYLQVKKLLHYLPYNSGSPGHLKHRAAANR